MSGKELMKEIIERNKGHWLLQHIKQHLKEDEQVICKICNKSVDEIAEETFKEIVKEND